ncbi:MAG TPA: PLP-dependent aminotransferase family protein [Terriglobales bacterium]|nr:PLP-dependent aminotransferase family protein [Terriglobales bacterium]
MRKSRGVLLPPLPSGRPRRGAIYGKLRAAMLEGVLAAGEQLPASREAARGYGVSRGLMEEVYAQLEDEGFLERRVGRGTFVSRAAGAVARPVHAPAVAGVKTHARAAAKVTSRRGRAVAAMAACREPETVRPFNAGIADTRFFPWETWQRLQARAVRELGRSGLSFSDPRGWPDLRRAIARYLAQYRGIRCEARQVLVCNSAQQALQVLATLLLHPGDEVWLEDPCYLGARAAFSLAGAAIAPVATDEQGIRAGDGAVGHGRARMAYVTPSHQYPSGAVLSLERRAELLAWAGGRRSWVIEDDYDGEFRYAGQPLAALYSLDRQERVVYVGTFNKTMYVGLRLAYAVVPEELVEALANIRTQMDGFTPPERQLAMSLFLEEGHFATHLRRMRAVYGAKHAQLTAGLAPLAARGWSWPTEPAGLHLLLRHGDARRVARIAATSGLELARLSAYRLRPGRGDGLMLRFGGLEEAALAGGIKTLVEEAGR